VDLIILKTKNISNFILYGIEIVAVIILLIVLLQNHTLDRYMTFNFISFFIGVPVGILLFTIERNIIDCSYERTIETFQMLHRNAFSVFFERNIGNVFIHLGTASLEELFWRFAIQTVLFQGSAWGIVFSTIFFVYSHKRFLKNYRSLWLGFIVFSLMLSIIYFFYKDLFLVIGIHFSRNIMILLCMYLYHEECS
jgi:membrane protease YdiL (CAAX protease family)